MLRMSTYNNLLSGRLHPSFSQLWCGKAGAGALGQFSGWFEKEALNYLPWGRGVHPTDLTLGRKQQRTLETPPPETQPQSEWDSVSHWKYSAHHSTVLGAHHYLGMHWWIQEPIILVRVLHRGWAVRTVGRMGEWRTQLRWKVKQALWIPTA